MEIVPGVHRVPGTRGSNVYLARGERTAVIDTGFPGNAEAVRRYLESSGIPPRQISAVLLTHWHRDHSGSAAAVSNLTGAPVLAHRADAELAGHGRLPVVGGVQRLWRTFRGMPEADGLLYDGQQFSEFAGLTVLHTPGHTSGSVCFWLPDQRVLLTGDTVLNSGDRLSRPLPGPGSNARLLEQSLVRLVGLAPLAVAPGHGSPVTEGAVELLKRLVARPPDPLALRVVRNWRRLLRFSRDLNRRRP